MLSQNKLGRVGVPLNLLNMSMFVGLVILSHGLLVAQQVFFGALRWEPLEAYLRTSSARLWRYIDRQRVELIIADHTAGRRNSGNELWGLLTFEAWLRQLEQPVSWSPRSTPCADGNSRALERIAVTVNGAAT